MRLLALALLVAVSGCTHPLLLKKYAATNAKREALKGRSVFIEPFTETANSEEWKGSEPLPDPKGWTYREPADGQLDRWDDERRVLGKDLPVNRQFRIGWKRNGFGMPIAEVFSVNSPAQWLTDATRLEVEAQGAAVAASADAADVVVQAVVRHVWLDLYMATWVHLVLDVTTTARGQPPKQTRLHVADVRMAWSGSDSESYEIFSSTEQKLQRWMLEEIVKTAARLEAAPPPGL